MKPFIITLLILLPIGRWASAQDEPMQTADVIVPVIGSVTGYEGVEWHSDVTVRNDLPTPAEIFMTMSAAPERFYYTTIEPGDTLSFPDIARETFGLTGVLSPLVIQTIGIRPVTVSSIVYGVKQGKATKPQVIVPIYGSGLRRRLRLGSLAQTDRYRTNIGLGNMSDQTAVFILGVQRIAGRNVATTSVALPPGTLLQLPIKSLFPLLQDTGQLAIIGELSSPMAYIYASVVENTSNEARFVPPIADGF